MEELPSHTEIQKISVVCEMTEYDKMAEQIENMGKIIFRTDTKEGFVCLIVTKTPLVFEPPKEEFAPIEEVAP